MPILKLIHGFTFGAFSLLATFSSAQEIVSAGEISGSVGEVEGPWYTLFAEDFGSTSSYSSFIPGFTSLTVQGHPSTSMAMKNAVAVTFTVLDNGAIQDPSALFLHEGSIRDFYESADSSVQIEVTSLEKIDDTYVVEGTATGTVYRTKIEGLDVSQDTSDSLAIDISFSSTVFPES